LRQPLFVGVIQKIQQYKNIPSQIHFAIIILSILMKKKFNH